MPLTAYLDETMENFSRSPTPEENLVANVLPLRHAERDGRVNEMLQFLGKL